MTKEEFLDKEHAFVRGTDTDVVRFYHTTIMKIFDDIEKEKTMKYKGKELKEITTPQVFDPPKQMFVWDNDVKCDVPLVQTVYAVIRTVNGTTQVVGTGSLRWAHCADIPEENVKDYVSRKLDDFYDELECVKDHIEDLRWDVENSWLVGESENDECQSSEIGEWKQKVIAALPKKASVKFRNDVEELLEKFKSVY